MENSKIIEVVEQETAWLEHLVHKYSFVFDNAKYKLGNGEFNCPGEDFKKELTAVMNRLNKAIEQK